MRVEHNPLQAEEIVVSDGSESITSGPVDVFGCVVPDEVWKNNSGTIGRAIVDAREEYESTVSKIGAFSSYLSLHPTCIREGNLLRMGFSENMSVKYPFRIGSVDTKLEKASPTGPIKGHVHLKLQPAFGGEEKELNYLYMARHEDKPAISDEMMEMSLYNPSCNEENRESSPDARAVHLIEDNHILFAFDQNEDIVATCV